MACTVQSHERATRGPGRLIEWIRARLGRVLEQLPYVGRALGLVWDAAGSWTLLWAALLVVQGLLPVATVHLTRLLVNNLVAAAGRPRSFAQLRELLLAAAAMALLLLVAEGLRGASGWVRTNQSELIQDHISALIHGKSVTVDLSFYETPEFYDHLHRARSEAGYRPVLLLESLGRIAQDGITLVAMGAVLLQFGFWLPAVLAASTLPALYVVLRYAARQHEWRQKTTADERRTWYYDWLVTDGETAAEIRLFGLGGHFGSAYQALRARLRRERLRLATDQSRAELAAGIIGLLVTALAAAWMLWRVVQGSVTLGDLALFYQAFYQGQRLMRSLLDSIGQLYANSLFLGNLFEFLNLRTRVIDPADPVPAPQMLGDGIRFFDVSFRYPGTERLALRRFNLAIPAGKIVAVVGPNGAGKSTLIKLLCRLYDPDEGRIEIDGVDLRACRTDDLRRRISVLFQNPVHYNASARDSIAFGELAVTAAEAEIVAAARAAGADEVIARLPRGYENLLGRWFPGGSELSLGEWQRIALARAFLRRAPIILLDEPTSAMDSWAERDWMDRFRALAEGRTGVIITHRFTTAMRADVIHVMADGAIVESGRHDELVGRGGMYAQSWSAQTGYHAVH
ncbi:MAG: multidrug ABC transporter ATP-binding protein [Acidobacteria bacterium]|nr:MAG: multidrug ABC transporter ATP-binding protein [Acidobacteriota bacterium]